MVDFSIKQNNVLPVLTDVITDDGIPVDITGATVAIGWILPNTDAAIVRYGTVVNGVEGQVQYQWVAGDTAIPGIYPFEWHVVRSASLYTFPRVRSRSYYRYFEVVKTMIPATPDIIIPEPTPVDMLPVTYDTFEALRLEETLVNDGLYWCQGGMASGDGAGGMFIFDPAMFDIDNNYTRLRPYSIPEVSPGRFWRNL